MMKKTIYSALSALLLMTSCELEQVTYNEINPDIFPQSESDVKALVNSSVYYVFEPWSVFNPATGYIITSEMVTDYAENSWGWTTVYNTYEANDWHIDDAGRCVYTNWVKYLSSMILAEDRIRNVDMPADLMERYMAEIKCGKGFLAYIMYDMYGPIPIPDLEVLSNPAAQIIVPRLSEEAMQEFIETNLLQAADVLPYTYDAADYGRFTKGLAKTLLLKLYMMTGRWDDAETVGRELVDDPQYPYELVSDYNSLFSLDGEQNSEVIYSAVAKTGIITHQWIAHVLPSDYPTSGDITKWGGYKISWPVYWTFEEGDKRLDRIIAEYTAEDGTLHNYENDRPLGSGSGVLYYGAVPLKYDLSSGTVGTECEIDMPIYRYADVLTLLAEAIVRNGNTVTQEAVDLLNQVRTTHGGLEAYTLSELSTETVFLEKLLEERGHEFYWEGQRRSDLIRHGKFIEAAQEKARWAGQTEDAIAKIATQVDGRYKYERFPIPTSVINEGKGVITQNPGF